jgi:hypothetical protein
MPTTSTSPAGSVNLVDYKKAFRDGAIALGAVFITGGIQALISFIDSGSIDLGRLAVLTPILVPALTYLLSLTRRYLTAN